MPTSPGVYRMLDAKGEALYVGKARSLKKRVTAYTQPARLPERLRRMVSLTASMEVITTHTEAEALLLEANLIKRLKPHYNIVLRDDKSYPWLMLTEDHPYPQIAKHRGAQTRKGSYWGPFASAWAVNQTVTAMQRVFLLRSCADTVFAARTRPCLLFQIKSCRPCVGSHQPGRLRQAGRPGESFLAGKSGTVQQELAADMEHAAEVAGVRTRRRGARPHSRDDFVQGSDVINPASLADADVIAAWKCRWPDLRAGVLRPRRAQQRQPRLLPTPATRKRPECWAPSSPQFYDDKPPPPQSPGQPPPARAGADRPGADPEGRSRKVEILVPQRGEKHAVIEARRAERARGTGAQAG